jgi:hypothetical protein
VAFGTSGHRGSALDTAFNEDHILAISQAICLYRAEHSIDGPLFLGMDTHALSVPARASALEVLAANGVDVMIAERDEYTPTPAVSHAILTYNRGRKTGVGDGIVITPSHNPPHDGGFKYNPPHGGPAEREITAWIETKANALLEHGLQGVKRIPFEKALRASTTHPHRLPRRLHERSRDGDRHGGHSRRRDPAGGRSARRRRRALLEADCRIPRPIPPHRLGRHRSRNWSTEPLVQNRDYYHVEAIELSTPNMITVTLSAQLPGSRRTRLSEPTPSCGGDTLDCSALAAGIESGKLLNRLT